MGATPPYEPAGFPPPAPPYQPQPREGRPVSFYVAIFLTLLLFVSGGLNVLLLLVAVGSAASGLTGGFDDSAMYQVVHVAGDAGASTRILRIPIEGAISEAASPLMGAPGHSVSRVRKALEMAGRPGSNVRAVLFVIDSPGGGVTDSDEIHDAITRFRAAHPETPVVAHFGDMAASGGYYVAAACDTIVARPTTITGSIGVILSGWNFAEAARKVGVASNDVISARTPYKDILSPMRPMRDEERRILTGIVDEMYERFVDVVARGRGLDREKVYRLADGRIYTGSQAKEAGLVDRLGNEEEVQRLLRERLGVDKASVVEHRRLPSLFDLFTGAQARAPRTLDEVAATLLRTTSGPKLLYFWNGGR